MQRWSRTFVITMIMTFALMQGTGSSKIRPHLMNKIKTKKTFDIRHVDDSAVLLLVDYHEDVLQPKHTHMLQKGQSPKDIANLITKSRRVHRRLAELVGFHFFPHSPRDGKQFTNYQQKFRGRVIVTREANYPDACRFSFVPSAFPRISEARSKDEEANTEGILSNYELLKENLPDIATIYGRELVPYDTCNLTDFTETGWPWSATGPTRIMRDGQLPPLQGQRRANDWLGGLPNMYKMLQLMGENRRSDNLRDADRQTSRINMGGPNGIKQARVVQAIRGRNRNVRSSSPFALVEKQTADGAFELVSYAATYDFSLPSQQHPMLNPSLVEKDGQSLSEAIKVCAVHRAYLKAIEDYETCFAATGCAMRPDASMLRRMLSKVSPGPFDCCDPYRKAVEVAEQNVFEFLGQYVGDPLDAGQSSIMSTVLYHLCAFEFVKPIKFYVAGAGLPGVLHAAHDLLLLADAVGAYVEVNVLEDAVVDYQVMDGSRTPEEGNQKVGDWVHWWWSSRWASQCDANFPACALARRIFAESSAVCLAPPCVPDLRASERLPASKPGSAFPL